MAPNPIPAVAVQALGQSIWLDYIRRGELLSGEFQRHIDEQGIVGCTSNPTIFEKAISGSTDYDQALHEYFHRGGHTPMAIFEQLAADDVTRAADLLRPIYDRTSGGDGYVSIEVSPTLAHDTAATISEAERLWRLVDRPNLMVKVPATRAGIPAITHLIAEGINVNVTLIFALSRYVEVMDAYMQGLEQRAGLGQPLDHLASVASFFVSRVDTAVDRLLEAKLRDSQAPSEREHLRGLLAKAAIANAKLAYRRYQEVFAEPRWAALRAKGARVQRPLWASTSTKNPNLPDTYYVDALIGPETVDTVPPATLQAFNDHGHVARTLDSGLEEAVATIDRLGELGIDLAQVTQQLEDEGVKSFSDSFEALLAAIEGQLEGHLSSYAKRQSAALGASQGAVDEALAELDDKQIGRRIWAKDGTLWSTDPQHQQDPEGTPRNRLGWLAAPEQMQEQIGALEDCAAAVRADGLTHAVLLGMGGSSLASEVLRETFGLAEGAPDLAVLDSTAPGTILTLRRSLPLDQTLFLVASKSGTTTETLAFMEYFWQKASNGRQFVAITDPGTPLEALAEERHFRETFLNAADIGGRYSALSYFGLVPAAIMGLDLDKLLDKAHNATHSTSAPVPAAENPGLWLGAILAGLARKGRDKLTLVCSPGIASFSAWVEQLIAESTGKQGKGILPVAGEPLGPPAVYGNDRLFVYLRLDEGADPAQDVALDALAAAGQPVVRLNLRAADDLGAEFFRWEFATAAAGALLGIDPFDEPNVQESKDNTKRLLKEYQGTGYLPEGEPALEADGLKFYAAPPARAAIGGQADPVTALRVYLSQVQAGDYLALIAFLGRVPATETALERIRTRLRDSLKVATTLGFGPRYLHSTGQFHKGGPATGVFLLLTTDDVVDAQVPDAPYSFGVLQRAQALGDLQALQSRQRRALRIHLGPDEAAGLARLEEWIAGALR